MLILPVKFPFASSGSGLGHFLTGRHLIDTWNAKAQVSTQYVQWGILMTGSTLAGSAAGGNSCESEEIRPLSLPPSKLSAADACPLIKEIRWLCHTEQSQRREII
jgi:hypothetical protein